MDQHQHVVELFHDSIDTKMQALDHLSSHISHCGELIIQPLLSDRKILCCGEGQSGALAQIFATNLLNRFSHERPSLPAIALCTDTSTITAITGDGSFNEIFSKQIRALGQAGDFLLIISNINNSSTTLQAIQAAHDREMSVIAITCEENSDISSLLSPEDMELCIPSTVRARVTETQLLVLNCLCDLIDRQLFGCEE